MHPALQRIASATQGTSYDGELWLVGGAVRDELLGRPVKNDFDLVTTLDAPALATFLFEQGLSTSAPAIYPRFGTAMLRIEGVDIELITARRESYDSDSRKPNVEPASLEEDAMRRDFTINALLKNVHTGALRDPLGNGLDDLTSKILRTPLDPVVTFHDDPLRMLRAVRFRWQLGFEPAPGLYESIRETRERLRIISAERIRDELFKMLDVPTAPNAMQDLMDLGLFEIFAPEFVAMVGVEQGNFHHLDVWRHTLLVLSKAGHEDRALSLGALFHDVGKPPTHFIDEKGNIRFFGHEAIGADMTKQVLRRWKLPERDIDQVALLVKNHMRLGSSPTFTPSAARRLIRDLDGDLDRLLSLVEADASSLKPGIRQLDLAPIRERIAEVQAITPRSTLESPLSGQEIMELRNIPAGPEVGRLKSLLTERVLDGDLSPGDKDSATEMLKFVD